MTVIVLLSVKFLNIRLKFTLKLK